MKERNLMVFISAVTVSVLFIIGIILRTQAWFTNYASQSYPSYVRLILPLALLWLGWVFENKGFVLAASVLLAVIWLLHLDYSGFVSGDIFVPSNYTAIVKTTFVFGLIALGARRFPDSSPMTRWTGHDAETSTLRKDSQRSPFLSIRTV
jgi:magnesium-transporting ATPase (P-type)